MLPKTWSTTGVLAKFSLPKDHWNYPIKKEEQEPLPLPDYFYPITGGIKKNFAKKKNSDGIDLSNIIPCSSVVQQNMRVTRRMLSNSVVVKVGFFQKVMKKFSNLSNQHASEPKIVLELFCKCY